MWEDPIVAEMRKARDEHAAKFDYDLRRIFEDLIEQQKRSGRPTVSLPPRPAQHPVVPAKTKPDRAA